MRVRGLVSSVISGVATASCSLLVDSAGLTGNRSATAIDASTDVALVTDGATADAPLAPAKWRPGPSGPSARHSARALYDGRRKKVLLFGGLGDVRYSDTWAWDGSAWTKLAVSPEPTERQGCGFAFDEARGVSVLLGGQYHSGDAWELDGAGWKQTSNVGVPIRMAGFAMAYDAKRKLSVGFGGIDDNGGGLRDTWAWDGTIAKKLAPANSPPDLRGHAMAYDAARERVVLLGGLSGSGTYSGSMWLFDGATWTENKASGPSERTSACIGYDPDRARVVLFGGRRDDNAYSDTWFWDGASWTRGPDGPPARRSCAMAYDAARRAIVMFGGTGSGTGRAGMNDTWLLD